VREIAADRAALSHLEPVEPDYIRQSGDPMTEGEQVSWFQEARAEAEAEGAMHLRYSVHPEIPNLRLVEGWKDRPSNEGEPRWQLQAG
jgi:hypothetical protein